MTALRERSAFHSCLWTRAGLGRTAATAMPSVASRWLRPLRGVSEVDTRFSAQGVPVSTLRISLPRLDRSPSALPPGPRAGAPSRQRLISSHAVARSLPQVWLLLDLHLWPPSLSRTPGRPLSSRRANSPLPPAPLHTVGLIGPHGSCCRYSHGHSSSFLSCLSQGGHSLVSTELPARIVTVRHLFDAHGDAACGDDSTTMPLSREAPDRMRCATAQVNADSETLG